jgi:uncharacterized protein GlcG (DUF336 family)
MNWHRFPSRLLAIALVVMCCGTFVNCGGGGSGDSISLPVYLPVVPLDATEVEILVRRAARAVDDQRMVVAVCDRVGRPLAIWRRNPGLTGEREINIALSMARTGAFMSSSQGPITSRTLEFISTFHFPAVFGNLTRNPIPTSPFTLDNTLASQRTTLDVEGTASGPLWQIFSSNRGAPFAGQDLVNKDGQTVPATDFSAPPAAMPGFPSFGSMRIPPAGRVDAAGNPIFNQPGSGLTYLPGGIPIYKLGDFTDLPPSAMSNSQVDFIGRVVGGIGVYIENAAGEPQIDAMEFASIEALRGPEPEDRFFAVPQNVLQQIFQQNAGTLNFLADPAEFGLDFSDVNPADFASEADFIARKLNFLFPVSIVPPQGRIVLVGILLPYIQQVSRPAGAVADPTVNIALDQAFGQGAFSVMPTAGGDQPWGYIIGPRGDPDVTAMGQPFFNPNGLTQVEVEQIVDQSIATSNGTRAAIRVPLGSAAKMVITLTNLRGLILAAYRMEDAPIFSYDVSLTKSRVVTYYSSGPGQIPDIQPADVALLNNAGIPVGVPGSPVENGCAITTRSLRFLTQPFFPQGIVSSPFIGPMLDLATTNADPFQWDRMGSALPSPSLQSGIIFFPGATPLYKNGQLVGGLGISGDGVEQDDFVTNGGFRGFEPPAEIKVDNFSYEGVNIPFFKFPQLPGPGAGN